jgi:hypothetical protein
MPFIQPTRGDVHVNRPLTNISVAYLQSQNSFVADRVFPNIPVAKQSDRFFTYDRGEFNRDEMKERAPGTESAGGTYSLDSTPTYYAPVQSFHKDIPDQIRANTDSPLNPDREATEYVTHKGLIRRERTFVSNFFTTGIWTYQADGVSSGATAASSFDPTNGSNNNKLQWNDAASTPIEDMRQGLRYVHESTGFRPNKAVMGRPVYDTLVDHPDIVARLDRGQTTGPAKANREAIAALLELDEVLVMDAIYNSAKKGATNAHSFIGGKNVLLAYAAPTPGIMTPSAGYTFSWTGYLGATQNGMRIKRFRMDALESDRVECDQAYAQKLIGADLGYFFNGIIA